MLMEEGINLESYISYRPGNFTVLNLLRESWQFVQSLNFLPCLILLIPRRTTPSLLETGLNDSSCGKFSWL